MLRTRDRLATCFGPVLTQHRLHRRQEEGYTAEDAGTHELPDREHAGRPGDALARLEAATEDRRRGLEGAERLAELAKDAQARFGDDYAMNKALRRRLRCARACGSVRQRAAGAGLQLSWSFAAPPLSAVLLWFLSAERWGLKWQAGGDARRLGGAGLAPHTKSSHTCLISCAKFWRVTERCRASFGSFLPALQ